MSHFSFLKRITPVITAMVIIGSLLTACVSTPENTIAADSVISLNGSGFNNQTAYNFVKEMKTGSTFGTEDKLISFPYEGYWGIEAEATENTVSIRAYSNLEYEPEIVNVTLSGKDGETVLTDSINYDEYYTLSLDSGAYRVNTVFAVNDLEITNELNIFVDNKEAWLCETTWMDEKSFTKRRNEFLSLMSETEVTPGNSLDWKAVTHNGRNYDNEEWAALSETVITDKSKSEGYKVMQLHDWLCDNTAFDDYALDTFGTNREDYYSDSSGKYDLYDTRVGVCTDVAEAFMIMCRYNGIPCVICENDGHRWNAVYINDFWYETDLTNDMYRRAVSEDMSEIILNGSRGYTPIDLSSNILAVNPVCSGSEGK